MKRFYICNSLLMCLSILLVLFYRNQGYLVSLIMRQDVIYFTIVMNFFLIIGIFCIFYQFFKVNWKNGFKGNLISILAILTTMYLTIVLILSTRIHITFSTGAEFLTLLAPLPSIILSASLLR